MTQEQIRMFLAVVDQGSFRSAARAVAKTQSSVSAAIRALEHEFDFELFDRSGYRPTLTIQGQTFYQRARAAVREFASLEALARQLATGVEPTFKLIINTMCPMRQVLRQLEPIVNEYAETDFQITTGFMSSITESLDRGDADLALTSNIGIGPHHEVVPVGRVHLFNVAAPGYFPETPITMNMLRKRIQVVVRSKSRSSSPRSVMVIPDLRRWSVDDLGTKKELLLTGLGWGRMPVHLIADDLISRRLVPIRVPGIAVGTSSDTVLVRRRDRPVGPIGTRIWQEFSGRVPAGSCDHLVMSSRPLPRLTAALSE